MTDEQRTKASELAKRILDISQSSLLLNLRFMESAIYRLIPVEAETTLATDGEYLYYGAEHILREYRCEPVLVSLDVLHVVLHCLFRHSFVRNSIDIPVWDLAADIAVESMIDSLDIACVDASGKSSQKSILSELKTILKSFNAEHIYRYYKDKELTEEQIARIRGHFLSDDHSCWYLPPVLLDLKASGKSSNRNEEGSSDQNPSGSEEQRADSSDYDDVSNESAKNNSDSGDQQQSSDSNNNESVVSAGYNNETANEEQSVSPGDETISENNTQDTSGSSAPNSLLSTGFSRELEEKWEEVSKQIQVDLETFSKKRGINAGNMTQQLRELNRERYDYTEFLKKFSVIGEVMKINEDEFDYVYYTYGLKLFENMPLIEPLEYKEVKRIREFVIAIDTSGSVAGETVQRFIQKTYNILKSTESFFSKINLHIIQCDYAIQEDVKITKQEEFDAYIKNMRLMGFGGTDFRPVFDYVEKLQNEKEFTNLKGLIYFTDGYGVFPSIKPAYNTAFVFVDEAFNNPEVPSWAIKLVLTRDEI